MARREGLDARLKDVPVRDVPGGIGGPARARTLPGVRLRLAGASVACEASVSMTEGGASGAGADYDVLMGDAALRGFDVAFDYWRGRVYLRPNGR